MRLYFYYPRNDFIDILDVIISDHIISVIT